MAAQVARGADISLSPENRGQFFLHPGQGDETGNVLRRILHQHIHVTVFGEIVAQDRAEKGQPQQKVPPAEFGN